MFEKYLFKIARLFRKFAQTELTLFAANEILEAVVEEAIYKLRSPGSEIDMLLRLMLGILRDDKFYPAISTKELNKITYFQKIPNDEDLKNMLSLPEDKVKGRVVTTIGRYFTRVHDISSVITEEKILKEVADRINKIMVERVNILQTETKSLIGEEIIEFYKESESTAHSCMTGKNSVKVSILAENPDKVQLITLKTSRALLWNCDDGTIVLDRIYPPEGKFVSALLVWAKNKGYVTRIIPDKISPYGAPVILSDNKEHRVTLSYDGIKIFPFLDTFKFGKFDEENKILTLSNYPTWGNTEFKSTNGSFEGVGNTDVEIEDVLNCFACNSVISEEDGGYIDPGGNVVCSDCFSELYTFCDRCNETINQEDSFSFEDRSYCKYCFEKKGGKFCKECNETLSSEEEMSYYLEDTYCNSCFDEKFARCDICEDYEPNEDITLIEKENGDVVTICSVCLSDNAEKCANCKKLYVNEDLLSFEFQIKGKPETKNICENCAKDMFGECKICKERKIYPLINNICKDCFPGLYDKQYLLPFDETNIKHNRELQKVKTFYEKEIPALPEEKDPQQLETNDINLAY